jgi:hypothetical protein
VEQRWFIGAHANVGGGYASDPLAQRPLKWLMDKAAGLGLVFREPVVIDTTQTSPPVTDSYREFAHGFYRLISRPFYRPVGPPPEAGTAATTARINETVDGSVFDRWRVDAAYRPPNLAAWAHGPNRRPLFLKCQHRSRSLARKRIPETVPRSLRTARHENYRGSIGSPSRNIRDGLRLLVRDTIRTAAPRDHGPQRLDAEGGHP